MNNFLSYCGLVDAKIRASNKDLPVKKQIEDQMNWFKDVFPVANATENMIEILLDVFLNLDPGLEFCIQAGIKQQSDQLAYLVHVKEAFNDTLIHLDTVMFVANSDTKSQARWV